MSTEKELSSNERIITQRLADWKSRLIDFTRRNHLIYFRPTKSSTLIITSPDPFSIFDSFVSQEQSLAFWVPPAIESNDREGDEALEESEFVNQPVDTTLNIYDSEDLNVPEQLSDEDGIKSGALFCKGKSRKEMTRVLNNLYRRANTDYQERGVRILHFAFASLIWKESDDEPTVTSPLILCPAELKRESARDPYFVKPAEEDIVVNPALQAKLLNDFKINLPPLPEDWEETSLAAYLKQIDKLVKPLKWTVERTCILGLFSFHKLTMFQDLSANAQTIVNHRLVGEISLADPSDLLSSDEEALSDEWQDIESLDQIQTPLQTFQILDADSSQQQCIQAVLAGHSVVLQGPPGTGKSQTISNVIAEFLARGKKVLFVSEKIAALEVVYKRLRHVGLGDFCLEMHSHKVSKREVISSLYKSLEEHLKPRTMPTERDFEELVRLREKLNNYVLALHEARQPLGYSIYEVFGKLARLTQFREMSVGQACLHDLQERQLLAMEDSLSKLSTVWSVAEEGNDFPWRGCLESTYTIELRNQWSNNLLSLASDLAKLSELAGDFAHQWGLHEPKEFSDIERLTRIVNLLSINPGPKESWLADGDLAPIIMEGEEGRDLCHSLVGNSNLLWERYEQNFIDAPHNYLGAFEASWQIIQLVFPTSVHENLFTEECLHYKDTVDRARDLVTGLHNSANGLTLQLGLGSLEPSPEDAQELAHVAKLILDKECTDIIWLDPHHRQIATQTIARLRETHDTYLTQRAHLLNFYEESFLSEMDDADEIEQLLDILPQWANTPERATISLFRAVLGQLCVHRKNCPEELRSLSQSLEQLSSNADNLNTHLSFCEENLSVRQAGILAQTYELCSGEFKPERIWFDQDVRLKCESFLEKNRQSFSDFRLRKNALLEKYDKSFLSLEFDELIERFNSFSYRRPFSVVNPHYKSDKSKILRTARRPDLASDLLADLIEGREILRVQHQIEELKEEAESLFGKYYIGAETNFDILDESMAVAKKAVGLLSPGAISEKAIECLCGNISLPESLGESAQRVQREIENVYKLAPSLPQLLDESTLAQLSAHLHNKAKLLSDMSAVPYLSPTPLSDLDAELNSVAKKLEAGRRISNVLQGKPAPKELTDLISGYRTDTTQIAELSDSISRKYSTWSALREEIESIDSSHRWPFLEAKTLNTAMSELIDLGSVIDTFSKVVLCALKNKLPHHVLTGDVLIADFTLLEQVKAQANALQLKDERYHDLFGEFYAGISTDWKSLLDHLHWARLLLHEYKEIYPSFRVDRVAQKIQLSSLHLELPKISIQTKAQLEWVYNRFHPGTLFGDLLEKTDLEILRRKLGVLATRIEDMRLSIDFRQYESAARELLLGEFLNSVLLSPPAAEDLVPILRKSIYQAWVDLHFQNDRRLSKFRGREHDKIVEAFKETDKRLIALSASRIIETCNARRPTATSIQSRDSEVSVLRREAAKKKRHMPVRKLFEEIPNLIFRLKPCLLMSPLSISQFLHSTKTQFDLVIFDEASQIFTEDAIGAIYRGKQLMVAGDSKQLPPSNFFASLDQDDDEDDDNYEEVKASDFSSLLDECATRFPEQKLRWHYRSRHESLIAFSNHRFYGDRLVTFPSAVQDDPTLGLEFVHVPDGIYDRGRKRDNKREAEVVTDLVFAHFLRWPNRSLGVVAFSKAQMDTITDLVEQRRREHPELEHFFHEDRLDGFFVKNLENVQGDERDVIIFSVGYGFDEHRKFTMNMGPLIKDGGERRLNVAITRAREKVVLVSSIKASDLDLKEASKPGIRNFYHYLDYAERGMAALSLTSPQGLDEYDSPFEEDVANAIRELGYNVVPQIGCSGYRIDLGVIDSAEPGRFVLGVECDGATYHSAATARDRDRLRQQVLENLGWTIHRIWSPDWMFGRETEIKKLAVAIETAKTRPATSSSFSPTQAMRVSAEKEDPVDSTGDSSFEPVGHSSDPIVSPAEFDVVKVAETVEDNLEGTAAYEECQLTLPKYYGDFFEAETRPLLRDLFCKVIQDEGPIHFDLIVRRLTHLWGIYRLSPRTTQVIYEIMFECLKLKKFERRDDFLWPSQPKITLVRIPIQHGQAPRTITQIPPEEIYEAILLVLKHNVAISLSALVVEIARLFGFLRTGSTIRQVVLPQVLKMEDDGVISISDDIVTINETS